MKGTTNAKVNKPCKIVSWATGTDAEIVEMLNAHYSGLINIHNFWNVGDERTVTLGAINSSGTANGVTWSVGESHSAETVKLVIMHKGLYELTNGTTCAFVVGQKNALSVGGYMNSTAINTGSWDSCARRNWCNGGYWSAIPSTLRSIFKQFKTVTINEYYDTSNKTSYDYFALFAEKEIFGTATKSNTVEANALTQIDYYKDSSHCIKTKGEGGSAGYCWERSPYLLNGINFCIVLPDGSANCSDANNAGILAPFGCI